MTFPEHGVTAVLTPKRDRRTGIDESLPFLPLNIALLTVSDTRTEETDTSGALLAQRLIAAGHHLADRRIVRDEVEAIRHQVGLWSADAAVDVIVSTGGTGFSPRDVTPEAIRPLLRREMDGFAVVFHQASQTTVGVSTARAARGLRYDEVVDCDYTSRGTGLLFRQN